MKSSEFNKYLYNDIRFGLILLILGLLIKQVGQYITIPLISLIWVVTGVVSEIMGIIGIIVCSEKFIIRKLK